MILHWGLFRWAIMMLLAAVVTGILGLTETVPPVAPAARVLFYVILVLMLAGVVYDVQMDF